MKAISMAMASLVLGTSLGCAKDTPQQTSPAKNTGEDASEDGELAERVQRDQAIIEKIKAGAAADASLKTAIGELTVYDEGCLKKPGIEFINDTMPFTTKVSELTKVRIDESHYGAEPVTFFIFDKAVHDDFTHVYGGHQAARANPAKPYIFFPCPLMNKGMASIVHEFTHLVLWKSWSGTLREGVAEYFQFTVAPQQDSFGANPTDPHADAAAALKDNLLPAVVPILGGEGFPDYGDAKEDKVAFYAYSRSFVHYLIDVEKVPMESFLSLYASAEGVKAYETFAGKDLATLRAAWIEFLGDL